MRVCKASNETAVETLIETFGKTHFPILLYRDFGGGGARVLGGGFEKRLWIKGFTELFYYNSYKGYPTIFYDTSIVEQAFPPNDGERL